MQEYRESNLPLFHEVSQQNMLRAWTLCEGEQSLSNARFSFVDGLKYSKDQSESVTQKQTWDKFAAA